MSGKEWGNPNTHGNLGNSFGQFHTQIRPIQTVFIFQTELKKESGFLLKRFVCQPNAIPTASVTSNSFLRITDARKSKNEPRWIIRKKWMNAWKKSRPCARMLKKSICTPWHPGRGNACVSCAKIRNKVRKKPNSEHYLRQEILCMECLMIFSQLRPKNSNVNYVLNGR